MELNDLKQHRQRVIRQMKTERQKKLLDVLKIELEYTENAIKEIEDATDNVTDNGTAGAVL